MRSFTFLEVVKCLYYNFEMYWNTIGYINSIGRWQWNMINIFWSWFFALRPCIINPVHLNTCLSYSGSVELSTELSDVMIYVWFQFSIFWCDDLIILNYLLSVGEIFINIPLFYFKVIFFFPWYFFFFNIPFCYSV